MHLQFNDLIDKIIIVVTDEQKQLADCICKPIYIEPLKSHFCSTRD